MPKQSKNTQQGPRPCIFCGPRGPNNPMSDEHLLPKWIRDILPDSPAAVRGMAHHEGHSRKATRTFTRTTQGGAKKHHIKVVCKKCNEGWMRALELEAEPYLRPLVVGAFRPFDEAGRRTITRWLTLKMLVLEQERPFREPEARAVHDQSDRDDFMRYFQIPAGFRAWIGLGAGHDWGNWTDKFRREFTAARTVPEKPLPARNSDLPVSFKRAGTITWGIHDLRVFIATTNDADFLGTFDRFQHPTIIRLWPSSAPNFLWPPTEVVTDTEMSYFSNLIALLSGREPQA